MDPGSKSPKRPRANLSREDLIEFTSLSPCSHLNRGWDSIFLWGCFFLWSSRKCVKALWRIIVCIKGSLSSFDIPSLSRLKGGSRSLCACVCVCVYFYACCFFYIAQLQMQPLHFNRLFSCTADPRKDGNERTGLFLPLPSLHRFPEMPPFLILLLVLHFSQ